MTDPFEMIGDEAPVRENGVRENGGHENGVRTLLNQEGGGPGTADTRP